MCYNLIRDTPQHEQYHQLFPDLLCNRVHDIRPPSLSEKRHQQENGRNLLLEPRGVVHIPVHFSQLTWQSPYIDEGRPTGAFFRFNFLIQKNISRHSIYAKI